MASIVDSFLYRRVFRETLFPLWIMISSPTMCILLSYIVVQHHGSVVNAFAGRSFVEVINDAWAQVDWFDCECWLIVACCFFWSLLAMLLIPGPVYYGPATSNYRPKYCDNGWRFYIISLCLSVPLIWHCSVLHLYYKFTTLIGILSLCGLLLTVAVYLKAMLAPDQHGGEHDASGNALFDLYCGVELHPSLLHQSVSLKVLVNTRLSLLLWQLIVLTAWKAHYELHGGLLSWQMDAVTLLSTAYLVKAALWEEGYMQTFDINYERFGFIFTFGCLAIVPSLYTLPNSFLVENCRRPESGLTRSVAILALVLGIGSLILSYLTDTQRTAVRAADGQCTVWGQLPKVIRAKYRNDKGEERSSLLLASGFWGLARHMNYLFEALTNLAMALPTLSCLPFALFALVLGILVHRTSRDDEKCARKYGKYWQKYRQLVPYRMLPGVF